LGNLFGILYLIKLATLISLPAPKNKRWNLFNYQKSSRSRDV